MREKLTPANRRLVIPMACYLVLVCAALHALLPVRTRDDRFLLGIVLVVFTILIIKTLAHADDD
jgi:ABC-type uncharacterized transport system permease subunit